MNNDSQTDWERLESMTEEELQALIKSDPDCPEISLQDFVRINDDE